VTLLTTELFLVIAGLIVLAVALRIARDSAHPHRWSSALFWLLLAVTLIGGKMLPPVLVGYGVVAMAVLAASKRVAAPAAATAAYEHLANEAQRLRHRLLWPVLLVPIIAITTGFILPRFEFGTWRLADPRQMSLVGVGLGAIVALGLALRWTRERPITAVDEGGRLLQLLGWTLILPQMLAALGGIFAKTGVGDIIAHLVAAALPVQHPLVAVLAYCAGMALFTILLGNAFAAFPIITLGVGLPFVVRQHGGDPAVMGALGMLSGYCGTLVTPMAANFNLVPVRLLELADDFAVIRAQAPMAIAIWLFNVAVMSAFVYPD
jgi:uncharacterized membrane protein